MTVAVTVHCMRRFEQGEWTAAADFPVIHHPTTLFVPVVAGGCSEDVRKLCALLIPLFLSARCPRSDPSALDYLRDCPLPVARVNITVHFRVRTRNNYVAGWFTLTLT